MNKAVVTNRFVFERIKDQIFGEEEIKRTLLFDEFFSKKFASGGEISEIKKFIIINKT